MEKRHIVVSGQVQGVGFRNFTQQEAQKHHLHGWVRNREDGAVEMDVEGDKSDITSFIEALEAGNRFSKVDKVSVGTKDFVNHNHSFNVRY